MKNNQNESTHPLYVRVICWILIILMVSGAIFYTISGLQALFSAIFEKSTDKSDKKTLLTSVEDAAVHLSYEAIPRI